jgi:hypothetical protein
MPLKLRELIADLKHAGFVNRGGKGATETSSIRTWQDLSPCPARRVMMRNIIRSELPASP